jgi:hypothetical protein
MKKNKKVNLIKKEEIDSIRICIDQEKQRIRIAKSEILSLKSTIATSRHAIRFYNDKIKNI